MEDNEFEEVTIISHTSEEPSVLPESTLHLISQKLSLEITQPLSKSSIKEHAVLCPYLSELAVWLSASRSSYYYCLTPISIHGPDPEFKPTACAGVGRNLLFLDQSGR